VVRVGHPAADPHLCGGIVTAYNPASAPRDEHVNRSANARLRARLEAEGAELRAAVAIPEQGGQGEWTEPGYLALQLPRAALVTIAAEFGQNALVWIPAGGAVELVCTRDGFAGSVRGETISGTDTEDART
jgi:hypothetical protein